MKKMYFFALLLFASICSAQNYTFDLIAKYKSTNLKTHESSDRVNYFNTDNFSYYMQLFKQQDLFSEIIDLKEKKIHRFKVFEEKRGNDILFSFMYLESRNISTSNLWTKKRIEIRESTNGYQEVRIFPSQKSKTPLRTYLLKMATADKNLFPVARITFMHPFEWSSEIDFPGKHIVVEAKGNPDRSSLFKLLDYKYVETELIVPKKLVYRK